MRVHEWCLVVSAIVVGSTPAALAGSKCSTIDCSGAEEWDEASAWTCEPFLNALTPDRRPVRYISMLGLRADCDYPGFLREEMFDCADADCNEIADGIDWLICWLDTNYAQGWRRFVIFFPAGAAVPGQTLLPSSQYWTMPTWMRQGYEINVANWLGNHTDATLGIYAGWRIVDPCQLCMGPDFTTDHEPCEESDLCDMAPAPYSPQCNDPDDALIMYQNIRPWVDNVGVSEYWFDAAAADPGDYINFVNGATEYAGVHFGMEAFKLTGSPGYPDPAMTSDIPMVMAARTIQQQANLYSMTTGDPRDMGFPANWDFSAAAATTEMGVTLDQQDFNPCEPTGDVFPNPTPSEVLDIVRAFRDRGYVLWGGAENGSCSMIPYTWPVLEAIKRVSWPTYFDGVGLLGLGLPCPFDLNMDGPVDGDDEDVIYANWSMTGGKTLAEGDLSGDGFVNGTDLALLLAEMMSPTCPHAPPESPCIPGKCK